MHSDSVHYVPVPSLFSKYNMVTSVSEEVYTINHYFVFMRSYLF